MVHVNCIGWIMGTCVGVKNKFGNGTVTQKTNT